MQVLKKKDWFHEDGFPIEVARREPQTPFGLHVHEFSEIVLITGGSGIHLTGDDAFELSVGDAFVVGGNRPHGYSNLNQLRLINILFDGADLPMSVGDLPSLPGYHWMFNLEPTWHEQQPFTSRLKLCPAELVEAIQLIERLEYELQERLPGFGVMATFILLQLTTFLSRCYSRSRNSPAPTLSGIAATISYIEQHYAESITLAELVEISRLSRRNFLRVFESTMGHSPIAFLIRMRIRHASRMLSSTNRSITEIALAVGFSDSNYFTRQFHAHTGVSPRDYRRRYQDRLDAPRHPY